jgi:hypothetical protein
VRRADTLASTLCSSLLASAAAAQESPNIVAPTQPAPGSVVARLGLRAIVFDGGEPDVARDGFVLEERLRLTYGITKELSVDGTLPFYQGSFDEPAPGQAPFETSPVGLGDLDVNLKFRLFKEDVGPVDTVRMSVFAGTEMPTGTGGFGTESFDPQVGLAAMAILGRHGFSGSLAYRFVTGDTDEALFPGDSGADVFAANVGYLYRLAPDEFAEEHVGAWYATVELLSTAETNGDFELTLTPGILFEAPRFAFELTVGFPIVDDVQYRPSSSFSGSIGLRFLF